MHPSRDSGANFEAISGPAQFQVRTPEAISASCGPPSDGQDALQGSWPRRELSGPSPGGRRTVGEDRRPK
eukprot:15481532-Alexandrium_andersonii.AAC.1